MQYYIRAGGDTAMDIDHFNPKRYDRNSYDNLFLSTRFCNGAKSNYWPTKTEQEIGIRFLNPCDEQDYGVHLFEDLESGEIWSDTPAGRYHIRILRLNAEHLVSERKLRTKFCHVLDAKNSIFESIGRPVSDDKKVHHGIAAAIEYMKHCIPVIASKKKS